MMGLFLEKVVRSFCSKSAEPYLYASLDQFAGGYTKPKGTKQMPSLCCSSQEMWKSAPTDRELWNIYEKGWMAHT